LFELTTQFEDGCEVEYNNSLTYFESLAYLETVVFTIGYGHISPVCTSGKVFSVFFAYFSIPLVVYILAISGRKIADEIFKLESKLMPNTAKQFLRRLLTIVLVDIVILILFMLIPAAIVVTIDCFSYGDALWYTFATISTIGFGDVVAGAGYNDECGKVETNPHHTNLFWFCKMCFLLVSLGFMAATWIVKYETILDCFYKGPQKSGRKQLIDNASLDAIEVGDMNNTPRQA